VLNRYFDCQIPPILEAGGEVLKFIGDGLLAIFPIAGDAVEVSHRCHEVLAAARRARANLAALDVPELAAAEGPRFGLALHVGRVLYGNIGGGNRLDFTCIGPAVNLAARIEKLCRGLGRSVLASAAFARYAELETTALGSFALAGIAAPEPVFGLVDEQPTDSSPAPTIC
jgi:adenylate cyclase